MCIGEDFVAICLDAVVDEDRERVKSKLMDLNKEIILLTRDQIEKNFCGNML